MAARLRPGGRLRRRKLAAWAIMGVVAPKRRATIWHECGRALVRWGHPRLSLSLYRRAAALDPQNPRIWLHRAAAAVRAGDLQDAGLCYRALVRLDPENPRAYCRLAALYDVLGAPHAGLEICRAGLARVREAACLHRQVGRLLFNTGSVPEALRSLQRAAELSPAHGDTQYYVGLALRQMGRMEEARQALRRALDLRPDDPKLYYALGLCCTHSPQGEPPVSLLLQGLAAEQLAAGLEWPQEGISPG